ncbi:MAG: ribulose-phosphate 3-epimerase [Deferribacteres bacterium]|nr:ribulose-phosphate 3-epimerase [candidate division KSB1 bacterium]MCB9503765.1 ribulose-phosphate 3-epimerase [Deferribacteres bacterium]
MPNPRQIYMAPSILSADLLKLEEQVNQVAKNGADFIHVDVMDGHFVPNLTFGHNMVATLKRFVDIPIDTHLMISNPDMYIEAYAEAGSGILTVHQEVCTHLHRTLQAIRQCGMKAGVSLNPATNVNTLEDVIDELDLILIMTVNPGFGGQTFIPRSLDKIRAARNLIEASGRNIRLEVDGGINTETVAQVIAAGADTLVAGSAIFNKPDIVKAMQDIRTAGEKMLQ